MRLWQFGRLEGNKIRIKDDIGRRLGLVDGSQAFSTMFRYEQNGRSSYEIVLSTFGPENYRQICDATFVMFDKPGACAQVAKFLGERNVDILNSVSLSVVPDAVMVWKMLVDLSYYGDQESLRAEFEQLKKIKSPKLEKVDRMEIEYSRIGDRYVRGAVPESQIVMTKAIRSKRSMSTINNGSFELPPEFRDALKDIKDGRPLMMIGDTDSWILSISFLDPDSKLVQTKFVVPDKPGSIGCVLGALADHNVNLLAVHTIVTKYYDSMLLEAVADVSQSDVDIGKLNDLVKDSLSKFKGNYELLSMEQIRF